IKQLIRYFSLKPYLKKWATDGTKNKVIIAYSINPIFTKSLSFIKRVNPNIITNLIVPDLPQYMNMNKKNNLMYKLLEKFELYQTNKDKKNIDSFVLLTQLMSMELNINKQYVVVEGISPSRELFDSIDNEK